MGQQHFLQVADFPYRSIQTKSEPSRESHPSKVLISLGELPLQVVEQISHLQAVLPLQPHPQTVL